MVQGSRLHTELCTIHSAVLTVQTYGFVEEGGGAPPQLFTDKSVYVYSELCVVTEIRCTVASLGPLPIRV